MTRKKESDKPPNGGATGPRNVPMPPENGTTEATPEPTDGESKRPAQPFSLPAGNGVYIEAALWPSVIKIADKDVTVYSVTVRKSWKDKTSGEWKNSSFFRTSELFLVRYLLNRAEEWILSLRVEADIPF